MQTEIAPLAPSQRLRARLLEVLPAHVGALGWSVAALQAAAREAGMTEGELALAAPDGVVDMIDAFTDRADQAMLAALAEADLKRMKIRERVTFAVQQRLLVQAPFKAAAQKVTLALALPSRASLGPRLIWRTADRIWRALGDPSTDFNFYSKRAILAGVLASTYARWFTDDSADHAATFAFLADRIGNVMQIEKLKAQAKPLAEAAGLWAGLAARARYGRG